MKKLIVRIGIGVVVLVIVALAVVFFSLNSIVKKGVETVGPRLTKTEVRLGSANISPFSGSGELSHLFVGNPEGYKTASAIQVGNVKLAVKVASVTSDVVVINELNIQSPEITLEGSLSGNNISKLLENVKSVVSSGQPQTKSAESGKKSEKKFIVKDLVLEGAKVNLSLNMPIFSGKSLAVTIPAIHLQDIGTAQNGVTAGELVETIMKPLLSNITTAVEQEIASLGKQVNQLGKQGADQINKTTKGITDLFKKK